MGLRCRTGSERDGEAVVSGGEGFLPLQVGRLAEAEEALRAKWKRAGHGRPAVWTLWSGFFL